jgi:hypothetical protein
MRNASEDLRLGIQKRLTPLAKNLGLRGRVALGSLGGAISGLPLGLLGMALTGPVGAAVPVLAMGAMTGVQVYRSLKLADRVNRALPAVRQHLARLVTPDQLAAIPPQALQGVAAAMVRQHGTPEAVASLSPEQFQQDLAALDPSRAS